VSRKWRRGEARALKSTRFPDVPAQSPECAVGDSDLAIADLARVRPHLLAGLVTGSKRIKGQQKMICWSLHSAIQ